MLSKPIAYEIKKIAVILATLIGIYSVGIADSGQQSSTPKAPITLVKKNGGASTIRPKAPDRQVITCAYDGEALYLNFVLPEGLATLSLTDEFQLKENHEIDTESREVILLIEPLHGSTIVSLETERGNSYDGILE